MLINSDFMGPGRPKVGFRNLMMQSTSDPDESVVWHMPYVSMGVWMDCEGARKPWEKQEGSGKEHWPRTPDPKWHQLTPINLHLNLTDTGFARLWSLQPVQTSDAVALTSRPLLPPAGRSIKVVFGS